MSKKFASSVVALALASFCGLSQADSVQFTGFTHGSETVTAKLTAPNVTVTKTVPGGGFSTVLNGGASFESYCVDLYQTIQFNVPPYPEYVNVGLAHLFTNADAYVDLGRLYVRAGAVTTAMQEAAFQIAVWEIAYEKTENPYDLSDGSAIFTASAGAFGLAKSWLDNLGDKTTTITVLESGLHQDVIYALNPRIATTIPEPSMVLLMAAGLLGVAAKSRRRTKTKV